MLIRLLASMLCGCWWAAEFIRSSFRDREPGNDWDKGTSRLWDASHLIALIGMAVGFTHLGYVRDGEQFIGPSGLALMLAGIALRWRAIIRLGRYFTGKVQILNEHHPNTQIRPSGCSRGYTNNRRPYTLRAFYRAPGHLAAFAIEPTSPVSVYQELGGRGF